MGRNVQIGDLADVIMETLEDYADLAAEDVKQAVREAGDTVRDEIRTHAPKDTGEYAKSWAVKKRKETSNSLTVVVHSRNRYQLAHLLEFGHAKRGGGRVSAQPHIAAAEAKGMEQLEAPDPPFLCYLLSGSDNFSADGKVYHRLSEVRLELYTDFKDLSSEQQVETALDAAGIFYNKTETWIDSEKLYEVLYSFDMEGL